MNNEYLLLHRELDFTLEELFKLSLNAVESPPPPHERERMRRASRGSTTGSSLSAP